MEKNKLKKVLLTNSILWASLLIALAILLPNAEAYNNLFIIIVTLAFVSHSSINSLRKQGTFYRCELTTFKKMMNWGNKN